MLENDRRRNTRNEGGELVSRADVESVFNNPDGFSWLGSDYRFDLIDTESTELYRAATGALGVSGAM
ncbi:hypothetical protein [Demequina litorisediminis]|uniref:Uncharacterized protein n=1 Tax=Demequina litorisediminis TaxID=1849022 RepID=A0ABQ6IIP3_9MICO|nr:hypothetical protein [Demequina litorisediminis]GMA37251.1 hypothetical protein GCM10025876_34550 [Demequina litorisediminis]